MQDFVHLHVHSTYSMTDGIATVDDLAETAAGLGQPALGLTDHGSVDGLFAFQNTCQRHHIGAVLGLEAYMTPGTDRSDPTRVNWDKTSAQRSRRNPDDVGGGGLLTHLTLWAETDEGLANMFEASSIANLEGKIGDYPRMDRETLAAHAKGLICGSGCPSGAIQTHLRLDQFDEALHEAGNLQDIFGRGNFYIELMDHGLEIERRVRNGLLELAKRLNAPLVATTDVHQALPKDGTLQDVALCINAGQRMDDPDRFRFDGDGYYLRPAEEMRALFADMPEACDNTMIIAERCREAHLMPYDRDPPMSMPTPIVQSPVVTENSVGNELREQVDTWLERNPRITSDSVRRRINHELDMIAAAHMEEYLLATADTVKRLREDGMLTAPECSTAAIGLVAYALGITTLNPLSNQLSDTGIEDIPQPQMPQTPVITITTGQGGMRKVLNHLRNRYGTDHALPVTEYSTFGPNRAAHAVKAAYGERPGRDTSELQPIISGVERLFECRSVSDSAIVLSAEPLDCVTSVTLIGSDPAAALDARSCLRMGLPILRVEESLQLTVASRTLDVAGADAAAWWDSAIESQVGDTLRFLAQGATIGVPSLETLRQRWLLMHRPVNRLDDLVAIMTCNGMSSRHMALERAMLAVKVGWVKMTYPAEFLSNLVDALPKAPLTRGLVLEEISRMGYGTVPVDINESMDRTVPVKDATGRTLIGMGLSAVPLVPPSMAECIVHTRLRGGRFDGFLDFLHRLPDDCLDTRAIRALIEAGAFDSLDGHKRTLLDDCTMAIAEERMLRAKRSQGQEPLFTDFTDLDPEF